MKLFFFSTSSSSSHHSNGNGSSKTKHNKKSKMRNNPDLSTSPKTVLPSNHKRYSRSPSPSPSTSSFSSSPLQIPTANRISRDELELVLRRLGCGGDDREEIDALLTEVDEDGMIDLGEITGCAGNDDEELLAAFRVFDSDCDGRISAEELHGAFLLMGDCDCLVDDCRRMIGGVDSDGDGFVSFRDFVRMMS